jgi:hypothetical protein
MADFNILDHLKNHSNENVSTQGKSEQQNMLANNSSFTSNFRTQVPTGAKLVLNPGAKHTRYQTNVSQTTGVASPTGLGVSLTLDNTNKGGGALNRPKFSQGGGLSAQI